jgi:hypothetical protein
VEQPPDSVPVVVFKEGEVMSNINIFANAKDPICLRDDLYPAWLWTRECEQSKEEADRKKVKKLRKEYIRERNLMMS